MIIRQVRKAIFSLGMDQTRIMLIKKFQDRDFRTTNDLTIGEKIKTNVILDSHYNASIIIRLAKITNSI